MDLIILIAIIVLIYNRKKSKSKNKSYKAPKYNYGRSEKKQNTTYKSEWKWNDDLKQYVHPKSKATSYTTYAQQQTTVHQEPISVDIDFQHAYQAKRLFTRNEWQNYKTLRETAEVKGYVVCPKVRLLDIIKPRNGEKKYKTLLYKIQAKHVDFVICDQNMDIKAIIELDDNSHERSDRKERDEFVDMILRSVGYKVIHTRYITHDILDVI